MFCIQTQLASRLQLLNMVSLLPCASLPVQIWFALPAFSRQLAYANMESVDRLHLLQLWGVPEDASLKRPDIPRHSSRHSSRHTSRYASCRCSVLQSASTRCPARRWSNAFWNNQWGIYLDDSIVPLAK